MHSGNPASRRPCCVRCARPPRSCLCALIVPVEPRTHVLILQHPLEARQAKGSARLLHLSLAGSALLQGERFAQERLRQALYAEGRQPLLLYPPTPGGLLPPAPAPAPDLLADPCRLRLVALDATWGKSLKMMLDHPLLQGLPRLALPPGVPTAYVIRKAPRPGQLSTLEAVCAALALLEGDAARYAPVLAAFDAFVAQQLAFAHRQ